MTEQALALPLLHQQVRTATATRSGSLSLTFHDGHELEVPHSDGFERSPCRTDGCMSGSPKGMSPPSPHSLDVHAQDHRAAARDLVCPALHQPAADLDTVPGHWRSDTWPSTGAAPLLLVMDARPPYTVRADVGDAAWNSCAGHLPWGQPTDQRYDDAAALAWDWPAGDIELAGYGLVRLRLSVDVPMRAGSGRTL